MRNIEFAEDEYYHIYNRGVDKRPVFLDELDMVRFFKSMEMFNSVEPIGSVYEHSRLEFGNLVSKKLVEFIAYCLNPNHYHFLLKQVEDKGIQKFMHRLGLGYTKYFNQKQKRSGSLFQGTFKAVHVESNEQLLHLSAYVNLNPKVHKLGNLVSKSSWEEYCGLEETSFCSKDIILSQFDSISKYMEFAEGSIAMTLALRESASLET